jgi:hypothetical protein
MRAVLNYKLRRGESGKPVLVGRTGASQSADGTYAQVEQVVDRENKRYRKRVVLEDGTVVKDYDGPLDGGHGDPRTWPRSRWRRISAIFRR